MPEVVLRPAEEEDIAEMLALYAPYVVQTTVSSEYDAPSIEEFTRRWRTYTQKLPWLVCRIDGEVVGYGYAAPHRTRAASEAGENHNAKEGRAANGQRAPVSEL